MFLIHRMFGFGTVVRSRTSLPAKLIMAKQRRTGDNNVLSAERVGFNGASL